MSDGEAELIRRLRNGDPAAFHTLVDGYARRLHALAYSLTGNATEAEDIVQETLAGVFKSVGSFEGRSSLWTWLVRILVRQTARWRRTRGTGIALKMSGGTVDDRVPHPSSAERGSDAKMDLQSALQQISPDNREIIILRELQQLSYSQISQVLGVPLGTVESRLFRARAELRQQLKAWVE